MVRAVIDGNVFQSPDNWRELKSTFKRDDKARTILLSTDGRYEFSGDAFTFINDKINNEGFCTSLEVSFQDDCSGSWEEFMTGNIFLSDCEVNERTCVITTTVQDNSYYAKVNNNKKIKTSPQAGKSKNNIDITPAPTYNLDVYRQSNDSLIKSDVPAIRIYDCFRYFIDFVSDGTLTFASNTFDVGGEHEGLCIVNGERLRLNTNSAFRQFSFEELVKEVNNKIPIVVAVETNGANKIIRVESSDYFDQQSVVYSFTDIYEINSKFVTENLYAVLKLGGQIFNPTNFEPEQLPLYGFKEEEFGILGVCNIDNVLDLSSDWISSPQIINSIVIVSNQDYDSDIILIDSILTDATNGRTRNTNYFGIAGGVFNYNEYLTNYATVLRLFGKIPNTIASFFQPQGTGTFKANISTTLGTVTTGQTFNSLNFTNVIYNIGSYYDGTDTFTAQLNGNYRSYVLIRINVTNPSTGITVRAYGDLYNDTNVLIASVNFDNLTIGTSGQYDIEGTFDSSLTENYYLNIRFEILPVVPPIAFTFDASSYWEIYENTLDGGIFQTFDPDDYPVREFDFDYPLSKSQFDTIIANPYGFVEFSQNGQDPRKGLIKELAYNHITSTASVKLITNKSTINAS
jgi:hypothetical protein